MADTKSRFLSGDVALVLGELERTFRGISEEQVEECLKVIFGARRVFFVGAGRSGLALRMAAMRMMHLGLVAYVVGEVVTPAIKPGDVLVVASGSGTTAGPLHDATVAKSVGADVVAVTTAPVSPLSDLAKVTVTVPAAVKHGHASSSSQQYAGSLFEQSVLLLMDILFHEMWQRRGEAVDVLWARHANLE